MIVWIVSGCFFQNTPLVQETVESPDPTYEDYFAYTGIVDGVKNLDPQQLAKLMFEHTDESLYLDIWNKAMTFSQEEYDLYYTTLLDYSTQDLIEQWTMTQEEAQQEREITEQQRQQLDQKSMEQYGKPMYQLPFIQAIEL